MTDALFDLQPDWSGPLTVRESPVAGRDWTVAYHYSAVPPAGSVYYGAYCPDLVAVVSVGTPVGNITGVGPRVGLTEWPGNLEITRVVCHPDAPKNTASRSIAAVLRHVHKFRRVDWVFSYADTGQNHHGGIYQALNATYVGLNGKAQPGYVLDGRRTHPKTIVDTFGTRAWPAVREFAAKRGQTLERVEGQITPKHCYILPCSTPAVNRAIRKALQPHVKPYPKRDPA